MATIETYAKPKLLYRYRSLGVRKVRGESRPKTSIVNRELGALEEGYIYCPTYPEMNDPMEGIYYSTQKVRERSGHSDFVEDLHNRKLELGIASFSETWDNELMWAHYADGFRGICVAYSFRGLMDGLDDDSSLARIAYNDRPYGLNLAGRRDEERAKAILSTKNLMWRYEREWRLFAPTSGPAYHGDGVIRHVYLGARMAEADRKTITARLRGAGIEARLTLVDGYSVERDERPVGRGTR